MSSDMNERSSGASVDHILAGLAVWAVMMAVFAAFVVVF
jgi:hypothetical protein